MESGPSLGSSRAMSSSFRASARPHGDVRRLEMEDFVQTDLYPAPAYRAKRPSFRIYRYDPASRLMLSWGYNLLVRVLFRIRVRDVDCAFKLFRREIFDRIHIESRKFFVDTEILAKASKLGLRMTEIGVRHLPRTAGQSTVRPSHVLSTLREIATMWRDIYVRGRI